MKIIMHIDKVSVYIIAKIIISSGAVNFTIIPFTAFRSFKKSQVCSHASQLFTSTVFVFAAIPYTTLAYTKFTAPLTAIPVMERRYLTFPSPTSFGIC